MRTRLIINPVSGRGRARALQPRLAEIIREHGMEVDIASVACPGDGERAAREAVAQAFDRVVVAGGDGTLHEVANGLAGSAVPLGIIPLGTGNVLARELRIPFALEDSCEVACAGMPRVIDLGRAGDRHFLTMAGIGFDAQVVYEVNREAKRLLGRAAFAFTAAGTAIKHRSTQVTMEIILDGRTLDVSAWVVIIGNTAQYGGSLRLAARAEVDDGLLDVCVLPRKEWSGMLRQVADLLGGRHVENATVPYFKAKSVEVHSDPRVPVQIDGELFGATPCRFAIVPKSLTIMVPPA